MMKFKKFLAAAMTGAMVLGVVAAAAPEVNVYAETTSDGESSTTTPAASAYKLTVDYRDFVGVIESPDRAASAYVILEVLKENKADSKESARYTYPVTAGTDVVIDLSFLKITKAPVYLRVHGDNEAVTDKTEIVTVYPQMKKFSMKYTPGVKADEYYKAFVIDKVAAKTEDEIKKFEYRTLYGSDFTSLIDFKDAKSVAEIAGTTLVVRKNAVETADATEKDPAGAISPEVKVKVPAAPKAPKVAIDYVKNTVKLPKKVKYAVIKADYTLTDFKVAAEKGEALSPAQILKNCGVVDADSGEADAAVLKAGFSIVVFTPADGKKADSVHAIVPIPGTAELAEPTVSDDKKTTTVTIEEGKIYATLTKTDKGYDLEAKGGDFAFSLDDTKWTTVKAGAKKAINMTRDTDGKLFVKGMGNKASQTLETSNKVDVVWYKINSIKVEVSPAEITAAASAKVTVKCTVDATAGATDDDKKVTYSVTGSLTVNESGEIAIGADTAAGSYTVTATSMVDDSATGSATFEVKAAASQGGGQ